MNEASAPIALLKRAIKRIPPPTSLFSGLTLERAMAPDNLVFFTRTDTAALRPEGVSDNYHHRFELVMVLEKAGPVRIEETSYLLQPGEAALIFPHQFHHYMDVETGPMEWLFITFELGNAQATESIRALKNAPRILSPAQLQRLGKIVEGYGCNVEPDAVEISYHLSRLLLGMRGDPAIPPDRWNLHSPDKGRDVLLEKINLYVRSHLFETLTIGALAGALGYSVSHLRSVFRTRLGVSLGRYIRESRLSEAAKLLQSTEMSIADVARESGFDSIFTFSRAFKKTYGMPPKAYSKRLHRQIPA